MHHLRTVAGVIFFPIVLEADSRAVAASALSKLSCVGKRGAKAATWGVIVADPAKLKFDRRSLFYGKDGNPPHNYTTLAAGGEKIPPTIILPEPHRRPHGRPRTSRSGSAAMKRARMTPQANDLRISALGREVTSDGPKKGRFDPLTMRGLNGWRASGLALSSGGRSADAVVLGVQNSAGEWVAIAAATPLSPPKQYLNKSTRMDLEFRAVSEPQKRGEWEIELPLGSFGELRSGVLRAWAMDFRRRVLYRLPDDREFL